MITSSAVQRFHFVWNIDTAWKRYERYARKKGFHLVGSGSSSTSDAFTAEPRELWRRHAYIGLGTMQETLLAAYESVDEQLILEYLIQLVEHESAHLFEPMGAPHRLAWAFQDAGAWTRGMNSERDW